MSQGNGGRLGALPTVIPDSLKLRVPKQGPPAVRQEVKLPPESSTYSTNSNKIIRFFFNNSDIIDFSRGGVAFDITITAPGATYVRVAQGIWSIFNRVKILCGGRELEDIREYNLVHSFLFETTREPDTGAVLGSTYGFGTQFQRNLWGSTASKDFTMPLLCGLFLSGPLPLEIFTKKLQLELWLEDPTACLESDCPNPSQMVITLTNINLHYETLDIAQPTRSSFISNAMANGQYPFKSFVYYIQAMTGATADYAIPHASAGIDAFINLMLNSNDRTNPLVNDKFLTWNKNDVFETTLKINNKFYPIEPAIALDDQQQYIMYLRWQDKWKFGGVYHNPPTISFEDFNTDRFVILYQLEAYPNEMLVNNLTTENAGNNVFLRIKMSAPPVNQSLVTLVQVSKIIDLNGTTLS